MPAAPISSAIAELCCIKVRQVKKTLWQRNSFLQLQAICLGQKKRSMREKIFAVVRSQNTLIGNSLTELSDMILSFFTKKGQNLCF